MRVGDGLTVGDTLVGVLTLLIPVQAAVTPRDAIKRILIKARLKNRVFVISYYTTMSERLFMLQINFLPERTPIEKIGGMGYLPPIERRLAFYENTCSAHNPRCICVAPNCSFWRTMACQSKEEAILPPLSFGRIALEWGFDQGSVELVGSRLDDRADRVRDIV